MKNRKAVLFRQVALLGLSVLLIVSCTSQEKEWQKTLSANSIASYQAFLEKYPEGVHVQKAKTALESLEFDKADKTGTIESYQQYLEQYPNGVNALKAEKLLQSLYFAKAKAADTKEAYLEFLKRYPETEFTEQAYARLQSMVLNWSFKPIATHILNEVYGFNSKLKVTDPKKTKGLAVLLETNGLQTIEDLASCALSIAFQKHEDQKVIKCSGIGLGGFIDREDPGKMGGWFFGESGKALKGLKIIPGKNKSKKNLFKEIWFLYLVPVELEEFRFSHKSVVVSPPIKIKKPEIRKRTKISQPVNKPKGPVPIQIPVDKIPKIIKKVKPKEPQIAKRARISSKVLIEVTLNAYGKVTKTKLLSGQPLLRQPCLQAVSQWIYEPFIKNKVPVTVKFKIEIEYRNGIVEKW